MVTFKRRRFFRCERQESADTGDSADVTRYELWYGDILLSSVPQRVDKPSSSEAEDRTISTLTVKNCELDDAIALRLYYDACMALLSPTDRLLMYMSTTQLEASGIEINEMQNSESSTVIGGCIDKIALQFPFPTLPLLHQARYQHEKFNVYQLVPKRKQLSPHIVLAACVAMGFYSRVDREWHSTGCHLIPEHNESIIDAGISALTDPAYNGNPASQSQHNKDNTNQTTRLTQSRLYRVEYMRSDERHLHSARVIVEGADQILVEAEDHTQNDPNQNLHFNSDETQSHSKTINFSSGTLLAEKSAPTQSQASRLAVVEALSAVFPSQFHQVKNSFDFQQHRKRDDGTATALHLRHLSPLQRVPHMGSLQLLFETFAKEQLGWSDIRYDVSDVDFSATLADREYSTVGQGKLLTPGQQPTQQSAQSATAAFYATLLVQSPSTKGQWLEHGRSTSGARTRQEAQDLLIEQVAWKYFPEETKLFMSSVHKCVSKTTESETHRPQGYDTSLPLIIQAKRLITKQLQTRSTDAMQAAAFSAPLQMNLCHVYPYHNTTSSTEKQISKLSSGNQLLVSKSYADAAFRVIIKHPDPARSEILADTISTMGASLISTVMTALKNALKHVGGDPSKIDVLMAEHCNLLPPRRVRGSRELANYCFSSYCGGNIDITTKLIDTGDDSCRESEVKKQNGTKSKWQAVGCVPTLNSLVVAEAVGDTSEAAAENCLLHAVRTHFRFLLRYYRKYNATAADRNNPRFRLAQIAQGILDIEPDTCGLPSPAAIVFERGGDKPMNM